MMSRNDQSARVPYRRQVGPAHLPARGGEGTRRGLSGRMPGERHPAGAHHPWQGHRHSAGDGARNTEADAYGGFVPAGGRRSWRLGRNDRNTQTFIVIKPLDADNI